MSCMNPAILAETKNRLRCVADEAYEHDGLAAGPRRSKAAHRLAAEPPDGQPPRDGVQSSALSAEIATVTDSETPEFAPQQLY